MDDLSDKLENAILKAPKTMDDKAPVYFHDKVLDLMEQIRAVVNDAEKITPDRHWPYPTYKDLLFSV